MAGQTRYFEDLAIGDGGERTTLITAEMVKQFATFSGDDNPAHVDPDYAAKFDMSEPSVHGMLYVSLLSGVLGSEMPGHASVYLSQTVNFHADVHVGDLLTASATVTDLCIDKGMVSLSGRNVG